MDIVVVVRRGGGGCGMWRELVFPYVAAHDLSKNNVKPRCFF
jgi:hypothetical protein